MKLIYFYTSFLIVSIISAANFGELNYGYALNIAGKQRMLSQRITKNVLLKENHLGSTSLEMDLQASIALFETNHKSLRRNATVMNQKFTSLLGLTEQRWLTFKYAIENFHGDNIVSLLSKSKALLRACSKVVLELETEASFSSTELQNTEDLILQTSTINISGEQRMLSQQFSTYFLAAELYGMQEIFKLELHLIRNKQRDDLSFLIFNSLNNDKIEEQFIEITLLFELLDKYQNTHSDISTLKVISFCDRITKLYGGITNRYTQLYEELNTNSKPRFSSITSSAK